MCASRSRTRGSGHPERAPSITTRTALPRTMNAASEDRRERASRAGRLLGPVAGLLFLVCFVSCASPASYAKRTAGAKAFVPPVPSASDEGSARISSGSATADANEPQKASPGLVEGTVTGAAKTQADDERAIAVGLLLDSAPSAQAIDEGLAIAAVLRRCYGLEGADT